MRYLFLNIFLLHLSISTLSQKITIYGTVSDRISGESLIGANVILNSITGVASNSYGFYSLSLKPGSYNFVCSYLGYQADTLKLNLISNQRIDISLNPLSVEMDEIVIQGKKGELEEPIMNKSVISTKQLLNIPAAFGQLDVLKGLVFLPGIQSVKPGTTSLSVRGGTQSQNLFLLDEAVVYNPDHSLSFFSAFNPDAIKDITVYKGAFPAQYGGRLSSVVDIRMKEGNNKSFQGSGNIGLLASGLTLEGPFLNKKGSFLVSGRYSYTGTAANGIEALTQVIPVYPLRNMPAHNKVWFYDLNFKLNYTINSKNRVYLSGYGGRDNFFFRILSDNSRMEWGNQTLTARLNHIFNSKLFSNHSFIFSNYDYAYLLTEDQRKFKWTSVLKDFQFKSDYDWYASPGLKIRFGLNSSYHQIEPGSIQKADTVSVIRSFHLDKKRALESAIYVSVEKKLSDRIAFDFGLRYNTFVNIGPETVFNYAENLEEPVDSTIYLKNNVIDFLHGPEPRANFVFMLNKQNSIKISWCLTQQYLHQLTNSSVGLPTDIWLPATKSKPPLKSQIYSIGYFRSSAEETYAGSVELYYRDIDNVIDYKDNADLFLNDRVETQLLSGVSKAYGIEFQIKKETGRLNGWISYTLSKAMLKVEGVNNNEWYPATYDRKHNLSVTGNCKLSNYWAVSSSFVFTSGGYCTVPREAFFYNGVPFVQYTSRNGYELPLYHRLDLSFLYSSPKNETRKYKNEWSFGAYNIYNRHNVFSLFIDYGSEMNLSVTNLYLFGIIPFVNYSIRF
jgi:hypothetical protein